MKWFVGLLVLVICLGFAWFAWDKVESHENCELVAQIKQLESNLAIANSQVSAYKIKFQAFKELIPSGAEISSNGVTQITASVAEGVR